jgi:hypothetical protein
MGLSSYKVGLSKRLKIHAIMGQQNTLLADGIRQLRHVTVLKLSGFLGSRSPKPTGAYQVGH